jgi:peptidoglycan-N-acetylglucosamine deacetylase
MQVRIIFLSIVALFALASAGSAETCAGNDGGLGASRIVEIDSAGGPLYGDFTHRAKEPSFLGPREVVLTFDDGPLPAVTRSILDTLDRFCTKATFFSVGRMAVAYPSTLREVLSRGHTVGGHTWSHPLNLPRLRPDKAHDEIERGFAAVALAAGQPIARSAGESLSGWRA